MNRPNEVSERLGIRQPQVSKHLRVLGEARIVTAAARHRHRIYRLDSESFTTVADWVASFESLWETRLDSLGELLENLSTEGDPS